MNTSLSMSASPSLSLGQAYNPPITCSTPVEPSSQKSPLVTLETTDSSFLIDRHLSYWCPLQILGIINSYIYSATFPFSAVWPCNGENYERLEDQFLAFYHHCKYSSSPSGKTCLKGRKTEDYQLNLITKELHYHLEKSIMLIKNIFIEQWVKSDRVHYNHVLADVETRRAQKWTFELDLDGKPQLAVYYLEKEIPLTKIPFVFLDGNEFEWRTLPRRSTFQDSHIKDKTWDNWKEQNEADIQTTRSVIFPLFLEAISQICSVFSAISVLDVGGCDGDLGLYLLDRCQTIDSYTIIEKSEELARLADFRSKCNCEFLTENRKKLKVICKDFRTIDILEATGKKQSDVIILSGVIAEFVLSREDSVKLVENCKRSLKDFGFLLVAAYSAHHFGAHAYRKMGFKVLNKSYSFIDGMTPRSVPFYVLQKETQGSK